MKYIRAYFENVRASYLVDAILKDRDDIDVVAYDPYNHMIVVSSEDDVRLDEIRDIVWQYNGGACVDAEFVSEEWVDENC